MKILNSLRRRRTVVGTALSLSAALASAQQVTEEIVVTATPQRQAVGELAQSVTVVDGAALERLRAANLGETLESQLGMSASYFGSGASRPIVRGLAGPRVRTLEDGIDSMDVSTVSVDHAVSIDPLAARQIEIFRGPTTLLYGSGAVGGIVNTVTNRIPAAPPEDGLEGAVELQGNTVADDRALSFVADGGGTNLAWHFDGMSRDTGDYEIPGFAALVPETELPAPGQEPSFGRVENSDLEADAVAAGLSWIGDSGFFGASLRSYGSNYGLPEHGHPDGESEEQPEPSVRVDLEQARIDLRGGWMRQGGPVETIDLRLGVNDYEHLELEGGTPGTRFTNDAWEGRLELVHAPWGEWEGAFGMQLAAREFAALGEEAFVPPTDTSSQGLFLIEQRDFDRWQLSMGARRERQRHRPAGGPPAVEDYASSFSLAAIRDIGERYAFAMNVADAERLPGSEELYSNGPHLATGTIEVGDATLGAERSRHIDVGIRRTTGMLTWTLTAFATDYDDYIYLRDTGAIDSEHELPTFVFTQADADLHGLEAELAAPLAQPGTGELGIRIFADTVDGKLKSGGYLPQLPPRRAGARLQYQSESIVAGIEASRYDAQHKIAEHETATPGYTMLNADVSWSLGQDAAASYEVFVRGTNLLDEDARRHTSFLKDELPLPGRNYALGFRAKF